MNNSKKVILFIAEGLSDKVSLEAILSQLIDSKKVIFRITQGDITSEKSTTSSNLLRKIKEQIDAFLARSFFKRGDIEQIVHLVDTDGAFVEDSVVRNAETEKTNYLLDRIETKHPNEIISRNKRKSQLLRDMAGLSAVYKIKYRCYFFSCNLEHVLHDQLKNFSREEKIQLSNDFESNYRDRPHDFLEFISQSEFTVTGDYQKSWNFIQKGCNSLNRFCNFHLFFKEFNENK